MVKAAFFLLFKNTVSFSCLSFFLYLIDIPPSLIVLCSKVWNSRSKVWYVCFKP